MANTDSNISNIKNNIKSSKGVSFSEKDLEVIKGTYEKTKEQDKVPPKYSYVPKITAIFSDNNTLELHDFINILQLEMDFTKYVFPLFSLQLFIPTLYIPKIQFDDDVKFKLELLYISDIENNAFLHNTLFTILLSKVKQINSPVNVETELYTENVKYLDKQIMELKLVPTECLSANKYIFSGCYSNCSVLDTMSYMSNKLNNKCFIQQPDNIRDYRQIIFPSTNVFYSLQYLDNYYGIYDRGLKMFYGFDMFRIQSSNYFDLNGTNKIKIAFSNESEEPDESTYLSNGLLKNGNDNFIMITPNRIKIVDSRHYSKEIIGTNISTFSREKNAFYEQKRDYILDNELVKTKSYVNQLNNFTKEKEFFSKTIYTKQIEISLDSIILDVPSWFKAFTLNFDSDFYKGLSNNFCLSAYYFKITSTSTQNGSSSFYTKSVLMLEEQ